MKFLIGITIHICFLILLSGHLTPANGSMEKRSQAMKMVKEGEDFRDVVETLDISPEDLFHWVHIEEMRTGLKLTYFLRDKADFTLAETREAVQMVKNGRRPAQVALDINTLPEYVHEWVRVEEARTGEQILSRQSSNQRRARQQQVASQQQQISTPEQTEDVASQRRQSFTSERIRQWAVPQQNRRFSPEEKAEAVRRVVEENKSFAQVAREMGTSSQSVRNWFHSGKFQRIRQVDFPEQRQQRFTPEQNAQAIQGLKEQIEDITMNPITSLSDILGDLKSQLENDLKNGLVLSEGVREDMLVLLEEVQEELSLDERINSTARIEIDESMDDIKKLVLSNPCSKGL